MTKKLNEAVHFRHGQSIAYPIAQAPMQTYSGHDGGFVSDDTITYYEARSESAAMIITEFHYVSESGGPSGTFTNDMQQMGIYSDTHIEGASKVAQAIKKNGNKALMQIHHGGRQANYRAIMGKDVVAPSAIEFPFLDYPVRALTGEEIDTIIADFGEATRRAIEAGFDGVEIHGANHYLIQQFFSSYSNLRDDKWGGSLENRMRFPMEVARSVMEAVEKYASDDFIIGYRISPEEVHGDNIGYDYTESAQLIDKLTNTFEFDYIHLSLPKYNATPENIDKTFAELFREVLDEQTKLLIVGQIFSQAEVEDALNYADVAVAARAIQIDPEFGKKIIEGRDVDIVREISPEQTERAKLTPGLIHAFSDPNGRFRLPGGDSIRHMFKG